MINEDDRLAFSRELGDHNARLKALEGKWEQVHQDLREIRDLIRQSGPNKNGGLELALHHFAESITKSVLTAPPPPQPANLAQEIATVIHANRGQGGNNIIAAALGAVSMIAIVLFWKQFTGG